MKIGIPITVCLYALSHLLVFAQQDKEKPLASSPAMGASSNTSVKRLASTVEPNRKFSYAERELDYLAHIWEGEYDNVEQLDFDKVQTKEANPKKAHERVHLSIRQFPNSNFGVGAVYVEEYRNNAPNNITRQCIYQLTPDDDEKALQVQVFHFKKKTPLLALGKSFDTIAKMTPGSPKLFQGCPLILRRKEMGFHAATTDKSCLVDPTNSTQTMDYQFWVTENGFRFQEVVYEDARPRPDSLQQSAYALQKARCFSCMIDFPNPTDGRPTVTEHYVDLWDQGGTFEFRYPDGRQLLLGMRNTWSFGMHRETFVIYILDKATKKTLIYSWGSPGADRIGFNPGWIRVQCDLKTPRNLKLQQELRPGS